MADRLPTPEELWGPDYRKHLQRQFDIYDAGVARERAEIAARLAGSSHPDGVPPDDLPQVSAVQTRNSNVGGESLAGNSTSQNAIRNDPDPLISFLEFQTPFSATPDVHASNDLAQLSGVEFTVADALAPPSPLEWCVEGLFARPSVSILVGEPGSKKTLTVIDLAVCVAMGKPWLDHPVTQGSVFFIDEQTGPSQLLARFNAALTAHGAPADTSLHIHSLAGYSLRDKDTANNLIKLARSKNARLIIIDAFSNLLRGGSESSLAAVLPVLFHLRRLAEACNAAVVVTHHTNRHGSFRGSYAIAAAADLMLSIRSKTDETIVHLAPFKSRLIAPKPFSAQVNFETSPAGSEQVSFVRIEQSPFSANAPSTDPWLQIPPHPEGVVGEAYLIYSHIFHNPNSSFKEIRSRNLAWKEGTLRNVIQQLLDEGVIERSNPGGKGTEARYSLARPP